MKVLVSDFDYTFFDENFEDNIEKVNEFVDKGNMFIIATSRNITSLCEEIDFYDIKYSYLICKDGGMIFDKNMKLIYKNDMDNDIVDDIFDSLMSNKATTETWIDNGYDLVLDKDNGCNSIISKVINKNKTLDMLRNLKIKYPNIDGYISDQWLNIYNSKNDKANGVEFILDKLDLDDDDTYTIGNNYNDILMVEEYNGYVLKNSPKELQEKGILVDSFIDALNLIDRR